MDFEFARVHAHHKPARHAALQSRIACLLFDYRMVQVHQQHDDSTTCSNKRMPLRILWKKRVDSSQKALIAHLGPTAVKSYSGCCTEIQSRDYFGKMFYRSALLQHLVIPSRFPPRLLWYRRVWPTFGRIFATQGSEK